MNARYLILFIFVFSATFLHAQTNNQNSIPELSIGANTTYLSIPGGFGGFFNYGLSAETRLGKRIGLGADLSLGNAYNFNFTTLRTGLRWYASEKNIKGGFLKFGSGLHQIKLNTNSFPEDPKFDFIDGIKTGFASIEIGFGFATIVKERITFSTSFSVLAALGLPLDGPLFAGDLTVGYIF
ncbi:MAG: hypothetical protein GYB31_19165 [Bacteroidetes bacterium]|nr:hypothetical protein [Bacteroidota bacterium]